MLTTFKRMSGACATTGVAALVTGSMFIAHPASLAAAAPAAPPIVDPANTHITTVAFSSQVSAFTPLVEPTRQHDHRVHAKPHSTAHSRAKTRSVKPAEASGSPQEIAMALLPQHGWDGEQWTCLDELWNRESGWETTVSDPASGAYGIPQALPGDKMAAAGPDWQTDAATQIRWGLDYIADSYGSPCAALEHSDETGYY